MSLFPICSRQSDVTPTLQIPQISKRQWGFHCARRKLIRYTTNCSDTTAGLTIWLLHLTLQLQFVPMEKQQQLFGKKRVPNTLRFVELFLQLTWVKDVVYITPTWLETRSISLENSRFLFNRICLPRSGVKHNKNHHGDIQPAVGL